jgi:hypothetical protein
MKPSPPEHIEKMDWRIHNLTWTTEPLTVPGMSSPLPAGTSVKQSALFRYAKGRVGIAIPNATALFLKLSHQSHKEAQDRINRCIPDKNNDVNLPDDEAFTFYEQIMASVVFACTALESFVNEEIPDGYTFAISEKNCTRLYNKEQIERYLNLDTKLGDVLPGALGVPSPKGGRLWSAFDKLRDLRDRIIHMKSKDRDFRGEDPSSIWNALLTESLPETYTTAKAMMKHFFDATKRAPRWFVKCPF